MDEQCRSLLRDDAAREVEPGPDARPPGRRRVGPSLLVDVAFGVLLLITIVIFFKWTRWVVINGDDWLVAPRGNSVLDYFKPYGNNLSVVTIAIYHGLFELVGLRAYWPFRLVGILSQISIVVAIYLVIRARLSPGVALLSAVIVLWYPRLVLVPSLFNHWFSLTGCIVALWALTRRGQRFDLIAALALTFAMCSSAVGIAGAAGCLVYVALTRAPLRRWIAIGVPTALVALWSITLNRDSGTSPGKLPPLSLGDRARFIYDGILSSFHVVASAWLGPLLAIAFVAVMVWRLRRGVRHAANELACCTAILAWWIGLAVQRPYGGTQLRYRVVTIAFVLLALIPPGISAATRRWANRPAALGVCAALAAVVVALNAPDIHARAQVDDPGYRGQLAKMIVLNLGPDVVPNGRTIFWDPFTLMTTQEYRHLVARYGTPEGSTPANPDSAIVSLAGIEPIPVAGDTGTCVPLTGPTKVSAVSDRKGLNPLTHLVLRSGASDTDVRLKRFGDSFVDVGHIPAGQTARIDLPVFMASTPWSVIADGACRLSG